jgi:hypothetical protein
MLAGHGIAHKDLFVRPGFEEKATVTAIERRVTTDAAVASKVEALRGDAVGRVEDGFEHHPVIAAQEDAEQRGLPVVGAEEAEELGVGDEASPALADGGGAQEGGRLRREAEEDLLEHIFVERQVFRRRRFAAVATDAAGQSVAALDLGMAAAAAAVHSGGLLPGVDLGLEALRSWRRTNGQRGSGVSALWFCSPRVLVDFQSTE